MSIIEIFHLHERNLHESVTDNDNKTLLGDWGGAVNQVYELLAV